MSHAMIRSRALTFAGALAMVLVVRAPAFAAEKQQQQGGHTTPVVNPAVAAAKQQQPGQPTIKAQLKEGAYKGLFNVARVMSYLHYPSYALTRKAGTAAFEGKMGKSRFLRGAAGVAFGVETVLPLGIPLLLGQTDIPMLNSIDTVQELAPGLAIMGGLTLATSKMTYRAYADEYHTSRGIDGPARRLMTDYNAALAKDHAAGKRLEDKPVELADARDYIVADLMAQAEARNPGRSSQPQPKPFDGMRKAVRSIANSDVGRAFKRADQLTSPSYWFSGSKAKKQGGAEQGGPEQGGPQ